MDERPSVRPTDTGATVAKRAAGPDGRAALVREADVLRLCRHPGVVELVGLDDEGDGPVLLTRRVDGPALAEAAPLALEDATAVLAGVAATLADLHDLGVVHGVVAPEHVLLAPDGRPVLCGFGSTGRAGQRPARPPSPAPGLGDPAYTPGDALTPPLDVFALGALATWLIGNATGGDSGRSLLRLRALAARATVSDPARRPTAREVAAALAEMAPTRRTARATPADGRARVLGRGSIRPRPHPTERASSRKRRPPALAGAAAVILVLVVVGAARALAPAGRRGKPASAPATTTPAPLGNVSPSTAPAPALAPAPVVPAPDKALCPGLTAVLAADVDGDGCPEALRYSDGVLEGAGARWAVGEPGDLVATGDWACLGSATVALLRPASGDVFVFDGWAEPGLDAEAQPAGRVEGGFALRAGDLDGDGCPEMVVERRDGPPVTLDAGPLP